MIVCYQVEVDETETSMPIQDILDLGVVALARAYEKLGCYYSVGYNPEFVTRGKVNQYEALTHCGHIITGIDTFGCTCTLHKVHPFAKEGSQ